MFSRAAYSIHVRKYKGQYNCLLHKFSDGCGVIRYISETTKGNRSILNDSSSVHGLGWRGWRGVACGDVGNATFILNISENKKRQRSP